MITLSNTERRDIIYRSSEVISHFREGEDAVGVLRAIYCSFLPDKSFRQGEMMARELLDWIDKFQQGYDEALENPEEYFYNAMAESLAQMSIEEQCDFLEHQLDIQTEQLPSESVRDDLLQEIIQQYIINDGFPGAQPGVMGVIDWKDVSRREKIKGIVGEEMFLAVTAMIIYTMAKNGELSGAPEQISLAQVAICVCTDDKLAELEWAEKMDNLKKTVIQERRNIETEKKLKRVKAVCITEMLASNIAVVGVGCVVGIPLALCGYVMLWLDVVLSIYHKATSDMIEEEAKHIPYRTITIAVEEVNEEKKTNTVKKHLEWSESGQQKAEEKVQVRPKVYT